MSRRSLARFDSVQEIRALSQMKRSNLAFFGGTLVISMMVMTAFANVANAGGCSYSKSAEAKAEEVKTNNDKKAEVEA